MAMLTATRRLDLNRHIGTELTDVQLIDLDGDGIDELRLLVAERGVVVCRDQQMSLDDQIELGSRLGTLHVHPAFADAERPAALRIHPDATSRHTAGEGWHT